MPSFEEVATLPQPNSELMAKVLEIIHIVKKDTWNELQELRMTCLNLEGEVKAVTARRDLMGQDLVCE